MTTSVLFLFALAAAAPPAPRATPTPAPTPAPLAVIEGTVKGPDNKPVDKARVIARVVRGAGPFAPNPDPPALARTDAAGGFRLEVKRRGLYTVRVEAPGLAPATMEKVQPPARLPITLAKGGAIEGTVRDGNTGAPLPRIVVEAREERVGVLVQWDVDAGVSRAQSDEQGRFRVEGLAVGLHTLATRARGFDSARRTAVRTGSRVELYLFPGSAIVGTVRDAQGQPIAKAVVRADGSWPTRFRGGLSPLASTDPEGRFEIPGVPPGPYRVVARAPEFAVGTTADVVVEEGADAQADVVLYRGAAVSGRLVGPNEKPVPGRVTVHEEDSGPSPMPPGLGQDDSLAAEAGPDGRFRIERVAPGSHAVAVNAPGYAPQRVTADVGTAGNPVDLGDIALETGLTIRGRVRDAAGSPIADAQINALNRRGMGFGGMNMLSARGETDGTFVLAGVSAGTYRVTVRANGYGEANRTLEAGAEPAEFVLDAAGSVTGFAVDDQGRPIDSFRIMARPVVEEAGIRLQPRFEQVADPEGRFVLDSLAAGGYVLQLSAPERADGVVSNVKVVSGGTVDVGRVRLGAGGTVRGTVTDGSGTPILGASVTARSANAGFSFGPGSGGEATSDSAGAFEIRGVPAGTTVVSGRHPQHAEGRVSGVEVDPAKGPTEVRLVLGQGGRVEGSVRRRDGSGVPNAVMQLASRPGGGGMSFPGDNMRTTAPDGTFSFDHVPTGRAMVMMLVGTGGQFQGGPSKDVDVQEGETATVEFVSREILVTGRVTRGGAPAPNVRVNMRGTGQFTNFLIASAASSAPPSGPQRGTGVTREDGSFELILDQPGKHQASAATLDSRVTYPDRPVDVPDTDTFTLDLNYSGLPVAGVVVDRETEQPIADAGVFASARDPKRKDLTGGGGSTGVDGRFFMELEPGDYTLTANAEGYARETSELTVGSGGASEVRVTLSRGSMVTGRVVDTAGRPVGGVFVGARGAQGGDRPLWSGGNQSLPDGTFQLHGLTPGTYTLSAQSPSGLFALRTGVSPGQSDVTLTLRRGGRVQVLVVGPDGSPVEGAYVRVAGLDGVETMLGGGPPTSGQGMTDLNAPAGQVELRVAKERLEGSAVVTVPAGGYVAAEITLGEKTPAPNR